MTASWAALFALLLAVLTTAPTAHAEDAIPGYVTAQRWLQAAEAAANEQVTYEVCGWGSIDLLTPFLLAAIRQGVDAAMWDSLTRRYEDAARERRRTEAVLTAHGANAPAQRSTGLHATGSCTDSVRERIERKAASVAE